MEIKKLSARYDVRKLAEKDLPEVLSLCKGNPLYYEYCPPKVSEDEIRADMAALPPGKTFDDKYYVGFYRDGALAAVMDLVCGYPDGETAWIGFFMTDSKAQGKGVGTEIIADCLRGLRAAGYSKAGLGFVKGNPQAEAFWRKNGFAPTGKESARKEYVIVAMEKAL